MAAPGWALAIIGKVAVENGRTVLPTLVWRRSRTKCWSTGRTTGNQSPVRVAVTAGYDPQDAKRVLLHELAHWLTPIALGGMNTDSAATQGKAHSPQFYDTVRRLYRRFRRPVRSCMTDEAQMYPTPYAHWSNRKRPRP